MYTFLCMNCSATDCNCDVAGITDSGECSDTGQCNCKANVTGLQCSECVTGYWNLTTDNVFGCQGMWNSPTSSVYM